MKVLKKDKFNTCFLILLSVIVLYAGFSGMPSNTNIQFLGVILFSAWFIVLLTVVFLGKKISPLFFFQVFILILNLFLDFLNEDISPQSLAIFLIIIFVAGVRWYTKQVYR